MSGKTRKTGSRRPKKRGHRSTKKNRANVNSQSKKQTNFCSEGQTPEINEKGIALEKEAMRFKYILLGVFAIAGIVLCFFDIKDKGMILEFMGLFKYSGSLAGVIVTILCVVGIFKNNPQVEIKR